MRDAAASSSAPPGTPAPPPVTRMPPAGSLAEALFVTAATAGPVPLLAPRDSGDGPGVSAVELRDRVVALALGLVASGTVPGSRVALLTRDPYHWAVLAHALWAVGAEVVAVHPESSRARIGWILRDAGCVAVAVDDERGVMTVGPLVSSLPRVRHVWQLDDGALDALARRGSLLPAVTVGSLRRLVPPDATAVVAYGENAADGAGGKTKVSGSGATSGGTKPGEESRADRPRGRLLSHRGLAAARDALLPVLVRMHHGSRRPPVLLSTAPLRTAYGITVLTACVRGGLLFGHRPEPDGDTLRHALRSLRPTLLCTDPYVLASLYSSLRKEFLRAARRESRTAGRTVLFERAAGTAREFAAAVERRRLGEGPGPGLELRMQHTVHDRTVHRSLRAELGDRLDGVLACGAPLDRELALSYAGIGVPVHEAYGLTEAGGVVTAQPEGRELAGTAGRPLPGVRIHVDADGEILVRGTQVFQGYTGNGGNTGDPAGTGDPADTGTTLRNGWLATGDLGRMDNEARLTVLGRRGELLVTAGGRAVAPGPLEHRLAAHPLIEHAVVVGDDRPCVGALITLDPEFLEYWRAELGPHDGGTALRAREENALRTEIGDAVARACRTLPPGTEIGVFRILGERLTRAEGLLTPALRPCREAVVRRFELEIDAMYQTHRPRSGRSAEVLEVYESLKNYKDLESHKGYEDYEDDDNVFR